MFPATLVHLYNSSTDAVSGLFVVCHPKLLVRDPEIIHDILVKSFTHFKDRGTVINGESDPMSNNILFQGGEKWKRNRAKLSAAFNTINTKTMFSMFIKLGKSIHQQIDQLAKTGQLLDIREMCRRYVSSVILTSALGFDIDCVKNPDSEFLQYVKRFFKATVINMFRLNITFLHPKLTKLVGLPFASKEFSKYMIDTVRENMKYRHEHQIKHKDFFQTLMHLHEEAKDKKSTMSIEEMAAQVYILLIAGSEASAISFSFCVYEMAKNPEIQKKAYEQMKTVLEKHDDELTYESIAEMKYIESCIDGKCNRFYLFMFLFEFFGLKLENYSTSQKHSDCIHPLT